jgi:hypothetical protein
VVEDRGTGLISSAAGVVVAILFMAFAAQVMLGLYATSTLRATLHDVASRAANQPVATPAELTRLADQAEASLGPMGDRTAIVLELEDADGDGVADVVVGRAVAEPPRLVPRSVGGMVGFEQIREGVRIRLERVR